MDALGPHWTVYVQALATPVIALIAGGIASLIAYRQWQTAKSKVVLDLFDKRLEAYNHVCDAVFGVIQHGSDNVDHKITGPFATGMQKSKFIFGKEVYAYLDHIWTVLHDLRITTRRQRAEFGGDIEPLLSKEDALMVEISDFHKNFDRMVGPYMRMDAKLSQFDPIDRFFSKIDRWRNIIKLKQDI